MKIGIDARLWSQTGVGRYIRNLTENLSLIDKDNEYVLFISKDDRDSVGKKIKNSKFKLVETDIHWHSIREQVEFPKLLNAQKLDLMHFPYFSVPIFYYGKFVVTVHDLIINKTNTGRASTLPLPIYLAKRVGYHVVMSNSIYRAKKIIVPSKSVRTDLLKSYLNLNPKKIEITYEGGYSEIGGEGKSKSKIEGEYIMRVGNFYPHKNIEALISAFNSYSMTNNDVKLVLVGASDYFFKKMMPEIEKNPKIIFIENPDDNELTALYKNAKATIIPSLMEGFSLTAVEAMSLGCPVLVSDIPVHREICRDAAIYFNPNDNDDMKNKIDFIFSLVESSRNDLIKEGKKEASKFSWEKMARETLSVYASA